MSDIRTRIRSRTSIEVCPPGKSSDGEDETWVNIQLLTVEELTWVFWECTPRPSNLVQPEHSLIWDEIWRRLKKEWSGRRNEPKRP